ncbi:hypothetical protein HK100_010537 [Physocladia obscura]|uniref:Kinesin motor domain-containing protein n=1 Tax=Physocladia obscura TaxID=109957 RepID=A0AAD5XHH7_9FUNG|nr:hypothetical protein HK100_010537 [Physocladia obscura]
MQPLVRNFLGGFNQTLVLFGSTGTKKSEWFYSKEEVSIVSQFLELLFSSQSGPFKLEVTAMQIYGQLVRDMLHAGNETVHLKTEGYNSSFKGFVKKSVNNPNSGMEIISSIWTGNYSAKKSQVAAITECITFKLEKDLTLKSFDDEVNDNNNKSENNTNN